MAPFWLFESPLTLIYFSYNYLLFIYDVKFYVLTSTTTIFSQASPMAENSTNDGTDPNLTGIIIGTIFGIIVGIVCVFCCYRICQRRRRRQVSKYVPTRRRCWRVLREVHTRKKEFSFSIVLCTNIIVRFTIQLITFCNRLKKCHWIEQSSFVSSFV